METATVIQGRCIDPADLEMIRSLLREYPAWSRYRLSWEIACRWNWYSTSGQLKDMACRTLLGKLDARGLIELPALRCASPNRHRLTAPPTVEHNTDTICASLASLRPLRLLDLNEAANAKLFAHLLVKYHYLGLRQPVGENRRYFVVANDGRPLACLLFGSAAWRCAARDQFIGWNAAQQQQRLSLITNNHRFLILPWVQVSCLASHILAMIAARISDDWQVHYGHGIEMLETFVEQGRFLGTCYRAANWQHAGETTGRGRQGKGHKPQVPIKEVYMKELSSQARKNLCL